MAWLFLNLLGFCWKTPDVFAPLVLSLFQERCINIKDCQKVYFWHMSPAQLIQIVKVLSSHAFRSFMSLAAVVLVVAAASESDGGRSSSGMRRAAVITGMCCTFESFRRFASLSCNRNNSQDGKTHIADRSHSESVLSMFR